MTILIIKIGACILIGFFAGPAAVYVFNHMPERWLHEYGEDGTAGEDAQTPQSTAPGIPQKPRQLCPPGEKRLKENPWRWVYAVGFICLLLRLSLVEYSSGFLDVSAELSLQSIQIAFAGLIVCWLLLIIALADLKYMIIPDQFVLLLALSAVGFAPLFEKGWTAADGRVYMAGIWQPLIGMAIGGGFMLLCFLAGKLIFKQDAFGFGDVKLCAAIGLVLGINGTVAAVAAAVMISGFAAAAGLAAGKYKKYDQKPLGPYLCGCAMAYILVFIGQGTL
mgnify:CR=1 FL=1